MTEIILNGGDTWMLICGQTSKEQLLLASQTSTSWLNCGDLTLGFTSDAIILVIYVILAMHVIVIYLCQS